MFHVDLFASMKCNKDIGQNILHSFFEGTENCDHWDSNSGKDDHQSPIEIELASNRKGSHVPVNGAVPKIVWVF